MPRDYGYSRLNSREVSDLHEVLVLDLADRLPMGYRRYQLTENKAGYQLDSISDPSAGTRRVVARGINDLHDIFAARKAPLPLPPTLSCCM